jgi:hypothetical protein
MVEDKEIEAITVAPRIRPQDLEDNIAGYDLFNVYDVTEALNQPSMPETKCLTIAVITMKNGFMVIGHSACASPENYDADIGNRLALSDAKNKMWPLMGYHLKQTLFEKRGHDLVGSGEAEQAVDQMLNDLKEKDS